MTEFLLRLCIKFTDQTFLIHRDSKSSSKLTAKDCRLVISSLPSALSVKWDWNYEVRGPPFYHMTIAADEFLHITDPVSPLIVVLELIDRCADRFFVQP